MYKVRFSSTFLLKLQRMYIFTPAVILGWYLKHLEVLANNPRSLGRSIYDSNDSVWQYRFGAYRMVALISDPKKVVLVLDIVGNGLDYQIDNDV